MIEFSVLASGSRANCIYVATEQTRVLVDCGLSGRETARRLLSLGVEAESIDAILVTHEHRDHVAGVPVFTRRFTTSVFANQGTLSASSPLQEVTNGQIKEFVSGNEFAIGDLVFEPFSIVHDAADPVGFRINGPGAVVGVITDLGQVTNLVRQQTKGIHGLVLEFNHDLDMLRETPYPWELKQRIQSRKGHLSNETASQFLKELCEEENAQLEIVVAAHVSENSNCSELVIEAFENTCGCGKTTIQPQFVLSGPREPTPLFRLASNGSLAGLEAENKTVNE